MRTRRQRRARGQVALLAAVAVLTAACTSSTTEKTSSGSADEPGPGVSKSAIVIGLETNAKSQENQGGTGLQVPEAGVQVPILVDQINAAGGVNGRKIELVTADFDPSKPTAPQENAACNQFTQDNKVFAVLALRSDISEAYLQCLDAAGTLLISGSPTIPVTAEILAKHPNLYAPQTMVMDRFVPAYVSALSDSGFFTDGKLGVLVSADNPLFQQIYDQMMLPALSDAGAQPVYVGKVPDDFARAGDTAGTELPKMAQAKVDRLMALEPNGIGIGTFVAGGAQAGFRPHAVMSTFDTPDPVRVALPKGTLEGVTGFGFGSIVDDSMVSELNPTANKCVDDLTAAGQQVVDSNGRGVTLVNCSGVWFLTDALSELSGTVNAPAFAEAVKALGEDYVSPWGHLDMTLDGRTGQHQFQPFSYETDCNCFTYEADPIDIG